MGILDKFVEKTLVGAIWALVKSLGRIGYALEVYTDSFRVANDQVPVFKDGKGFSVPEWRTLEAIEKGDERPFAVNPEQEADHYLVLDLIQRVADERQIPYTLHTDLIQLAKEHGWMTDKGEMQVYPAGSSEDTF